MELSRFSWQRPPRIKDEYNILKKMNVTSLSLINKYPLSLKLKELKRIIHLNALLISLSPMNESNLTEKNIKK